MSAIGHNLVRLGTPSKGDTIHRAECRYAQRPNALPWNWAEGRPLTDWTVGAPWLHACKVCRPDLPREKEPVDLMAALKASLQRELS